MRTQRFFQNKRGIDQIIAALLMVVIVVVASVMVFVYSTGLFGALMIAPKTATESITLENAAFSNNSYVSLYIRNTGSTPITLKSYYVRDYTGDTYARVNWASGPSPAPGSFAPGAQPASLPVILISSACGNSCTYSGSGSGFTFSPGNPYTVVLVTAINGQFSLTITR